jgi:hypothetical protein
MSKDSVAIAVSVISLFISVTTRAWNVYKELGLRARLAVSCMVAAFVGGTKDRKILISAVNRGPGAVTLKAIVIRMSWFGRLKGQPKYFTVIPDWNHALNTDFPAKLDVGQKATFVVPHTADSFLSSRHIGRVGVLDTFNREHWAPRKHIRRVQLQFCKDFRTPSQKAG